MILGVLRGNKNLAALAEAQERRQMLDAEGAQIPGAVLGLDQGSLSQSYLAEVVGGVAVVNLYGPIYPKANLLFNVSGGTSLEILVKTLNQAWADPKIKAVVLRIDSPGGSIYQVAETAELIKNAPKPTYAHASGTCASAAYWIASAARKIYANQGALVGSIGVLVQYTDDSRGREAMGLDDYTVVSSQSPDKTATPADKKGEKLFQQMVDRSAVHFISAVARYRGITSQKVQSEFGQGFVVDGPEALNRGMIDGVKPLGQLVAELNQSKPGDSPRQNANHQTEQPMAGEETPAAEPQSPAPSAELLAQAQALAAAQEVLAQNQTALAEAQKALAEQAGKIKGLEKELAALKQEDDPAAKTPPVHGTSGAGKIPSLI